MSLSIEQLEILSKALHGPDLDYHQLSITGETVRVLDMEIERRKHGPFTLAEAVASGRPFRRKGAGYWTRKAPAPGDGEPFFEAMTAFDKWEPCPSVSDQHGFTVAEEWLSIDDITACDYELNLDGGD
ncbi:MAG: hypothetical protein IPL79_20050 [Myxococcales bacterium]|nr:hypothetical protein [Myxococcales bacterium]